MSFKYKVGHNVRYAPKGERAGVLLSSDRCPNSLALKSGLPHQKRGAGIRMECAGVRALAAD